MQTAIANSLQKPNRSYVSAFSEGMEAATDRIPWTRCPYTRPEEQYERNEWLRGYQAAETYR